MAPRAAKHGGVYKLNMRYASAATLVSAKTPATSCPAPSIIASSSVSIRFSSPTKHTASVPTTFSFAIKPVTAAAASCHDATPTIGTSRYDIGPAIDARIESPAFSATLNCHVNVCIICTTVLHTSIIVPALTIYAQPLWHIEISARFIDGNLYSGISIMKNDFLFL